MPDYPIGGLTFSGWCWHRSPRKMSGSPHGVRLAADLPPEHSLERELEAGVCDPADLFAGQDSLSAVEHYSHGANATFSLS